MRAMKAATLAITISFLSASALAITPFASGAVAETNRHLHYADGGRHGNGFCCASLCECAGRTLGQTRHRGEPARGRHDHRHHRLCSHE